MREERVPAGLRRFVPGLGGPSFKEATMTGEVDGILADQMVIIPLCQRLDPGAGWADTVGGDEHHPTSAGDTWNTESWYPRDL